MNTVQFDTLQDVVNAVNAAATVDRTINPDAPDFKDYTILEVKEPEAFLVMVDGKAYCSSILIDAGIKEVPGIIEYSGPKQRTARDYLASAYTTREQEKRQELVRTKKRAVLQRIAQHLGPRGKLHEGRLFVDGQSFYELDLEEMEEKEGKWSRHTKKNGKVAVYVGTRFGRRGARKRFTERPNGQHNMDGIVDAILSIADRNAQVRETEKKRQENKTVITEELREGLKPLSSWQIGASAVPEKPLFIKYQIEGAMTVEKATALAHFLKTFNETK